MIDNEYNFEFLKVMDAITLYQLKEYLLKHIVELASSKGTNAKIIQNENSNNDMECPICHCVMCKNGHTKNGVQKYICKNCKKCCSSTSNTLTYYSKLPFEKWKNVIEDIFDRLSLRRIAEKNKISLTTVFNMRHKIMNLVHNFIDSTVLKEELQLDEKYIKINLKGTKPNKMPRFSKKRKSSGSVGLNKHLVCIASGIDCVDNAIFKVAGLGKVSKEFINNTFGGRIEKNTTVITDGDTAYRELCKNNNCKLISIPSKKHIDNNGNSLNEINSIHCQLENYLSTMHGVSTKHLQKYLDWFTYILMMSKKFISSELGTKMCKDFIVNKDFIKTSDICKRDFPVNLYEAYGEYHYGIYAD